MQPLPIQERGYANPELLAETGWLAGRLSDSKVRVIDARWPREYAAGHVPGAVNLNGFGGIPRASNGDMASPEEFTKLAGSLSISNDTIVVVYDAPGQMMGMVAWAFLYYGHRNVRLLDGGFDKWCREERPVSTETPEYPYSNFVPAPVDAIYCSLDQARAAASRPNTVFWDTRTLEEFEGTSSSYGAPPRPGRIPGAIHLHWEDLIDSGMKTLLPAKELRSLLVSKGITPDNEVHTY